jgi:hypothetical protein
VPPSETTRVIRPAAILRAVEADRVRNALEELDVARGGVWNVNPGLWQRYDTPWDGPAGLTGSARLLGTIAVMYGSPSRYDITIYRVTITPYGAESGWTVESLCDEALAHAGLSLASCTRAELRDPPTRDPFKRGEGAAPA